MNAILCITVFAILVMFLGAFDRNKWLLPVSITGLAVALAWISLYWGQGGNDSGGMILMDDFAVAFGGLMIFTTLMVFVLSGQYYRKMKSHLEEIYAQLLFSLAGALLMVSCNHLVMLFLGIETLSIAGYVLAGSNKKNLGSNEAAMKYFLMGSFATCFLVFGIALIYGASGSFYLAGIESYSSGNAVPQSGLFRAGILLFIIGLSFKIAAVPFHFWAPDVYEGSPVLVTAFMATVVKTAGIAAFYRIFSRCFGPVHDFWAVLLAVIAALTMVTGNLTALLQSGIKRMMGYSGIAHAGYLLLAVIAAGSGSAGALLLYSGAYSVATLTVFAVLIYGLPAMGSDNYKHLGMISRKNPLMAFAMLTGLLSLTGIPPFGGFMGKYFIFTVALEKGWAWLVVLAVLTSVISIGFYFKPVIAMYMKPEGEAEANTGITGKILLTVLVLLTLLLGMFPGMLINLL